MYWILVTALFVLVCQLSEAQVDLAFSPSGLIKQGDDLTITCSTDQYQAFEIVKLVRKIGDKEYTVTANGALSGVFPQHQRYEVIDKTADHQVVKIAGVLGADRGLWACVHINRDNKQQVAEETIKVIVPPNNIVLSQRGHQGVYIDVEDGETLVFSLGHEAGLRCVVNTDGTTKEPMVEIKLDDSDITSSFSADKQELAIDAEGLYEESVQVTYTGYPEPKPEDNGKQLTCTAKAENHHEELATSVTLEIHYKPKLTCSESQVKVKQGVEAEVSCSADMMPRYDTAIWSFGEEGSSIQAGQTSADGNLRFVVDENGDSYTFMLHVTPVRAEDFGTFSLEVTNSQGTASASVVLEEVVDPETPSPASTTTVANNNNNNNNNHNNNNNNHNNNNQGEVSAASDRVCPALLTLLTLATVGRLL